MKFFQRYPNVDNKASLHGRVYIKKYTESFAFFILRILKLFTREVCKFVKSRLILTCSMFLNVCRHTFHVSHVHISPKVKGVLM